MSSSKSKYKSGQNLATYLDARISGLRQTRAKTVNLDGKITPVRSVIARLVALRALFTRAGQKEADWHESIKVRERGIAAANKLLHDLDPGIRKLVGSDAKALGPFGMEPPKARKPLSPEDRLIAKQRAAETRAGLGTRGRKQRKAKLDELHGKPTVQVVNKSAAAPVPATPPASAANTAPAPAAASDSTATGPSSAPAASAS